VEPEEFAVAEPTVEPEPAAPAPPVVDNASITALEEELGAIEAELHALDHIPD
jgi:hypothetical protein